MQRKLTLTDAYNTIVLFMGDSESCFVDGVDKQIRGSLCYDKSSISHKGFFLARKCSDGTIEFPEPSNKMELSVEGKRGSFLAIFSLMHEFPEAIKRVDYSIFDQSSFVDGKWSPEQPSNP